jgi:hypothetical protein
MKTKFSLALIAASAVASQAAYSLWSINAPDKQVQVPCVVNGTAASDINNDGETNQYDCAGWWYGYAATGGNWSTSNPGGSYTPTNADGTLITTDPADGTVIPNGNLTATGIKIILTAKAQLDTENPGVAGLGFDYKNPKGPENITATGGYCLSYTLAGSPIQVELGWNEATYNYDTWFYEISAGTQEVALPWTAFGKDGWGKNDYAQPITVATNEAEALKFKLKNPGAADITATLEVLGLGILADCGGGIGAVQSSVAKAALSAKLSGRTLAIANLGKKSVQVEVLSLQGKVVASQAVNASTPRLNLSKVSSGVYVVKMMGKDVNASQMITLK